jgi:hypothetical protein
MQSVANIRTTVKFQASFKPNDSNYSDWAWDRLSSVQRVSTGEGRAARSWGDTWTGHFLLWLSDSLSGKCFGLLPFNFNPCRQQLDMLYPHLCSHLV